MADTRGPSTNEKAKWFWTCETLCLKTKNSLVNDSHAVCNEGESVLGATVSSPGVALFLDGVAASEVEEEEEVEEEVEEEEEEEEVDAVEEVERGFLETKISALSINFSKRRQSCLAYAVCNWRRKDWFAFLEKVAANNDSNE